MASENIDYDNLKGRGFLRQKQDGFFALRVKSPCGNFKKEHLDLIAAISEKYARGFAHATTRQGIEIPFIKYEDILAVENEIKASGLETGTSGARLRPTTCCPGNNWCKAGLVDTFSLYKRIEKDLDLKSGLLLPHKFKIAISGCPNSCTRPQHTEIGIHGILDPASTEKRIGYALYLGGCGGRNPRAGVRLDGVLTEECVLDTVGKVVRFFKANAKPRQRLGALIEEMRRDKFLQCL